MNEKAKCKNCTDEMIEITEKAVRKDKEVGMADLLKQEIAELQKAMIEEMARDIYWKAKDCDIHTRSGCEDLAKILVNEGYRNYKDKVVLSKEEYQDLQEYKNIAEQRKFNLDYANVELRRLEFKLQQARKETAKEILSLAIKHDNGYETDMTRFISDLKKQFRLGVEE